MQLISGLSDGYIYTYTAVVLTVLVPITFGTFRIFSPIKSYQSITSTHVSCFIYLSIYL